MDTILKFLESFDFSALEEKIQVELDGPIERALKQEYNERSIRESIESIDYTTLLATDTESSVRGFVRDLKDKVNHFGIKPAAVCVFSNFAGVVSEELKGTGIATAVVSAAFPASQSFSELKREECKMAIEAGADEVDVVLSVGRAIEGDWEGVYEELCDLREVCKSVRFKVILETGLLERTDLIFNGSLVAMHAGADYIKTSTGKVTVNATPHAAYIMCEAIKQFAEREGRRVGIKVAGGVSTTVSAIKYRTIVAHILGEEWLTPSLFRIGTSKLFDDAIRSLNSLKES